MYIPVYRKWISKLLFVTKLFKLIIYYLKLYAFIYNVYYTNLMINNMI